VASEDLKRRAYQAALSLVGPDAPRDGDFVIFREYPAPKVAKQMRVEPNSARSYLRELGSETYSTGTDEQGRFWRLRLPDEDEAQQLNLDSPLEGTSRVEIPEHSEKVDLGDWVRWVNEVLERGAKELVSVRTERDTALARVEELEQELASKGDSNTNLVDTIKGLKVPQVFQDLGGD
jgi:hypothetical protein